MPRALLWITVVGVLVRLTFLLLAGELEFQADEGNYVFLALQWNYFGYYPDAYRYLWPPGYPFVLARAIEWFDVGGIFAVKLLQVFASASTGLTTMLFAKRISGDRSARAAGWIWCFYAPLIGFTHYLWTESLFLSVFLPALYLAFVAMQENEDGPQRDRRIVLSGVLFAIALYLKEAPLYLAPVLAGLLFLRSAPGFARRFRPAALFLLSITVVIAPWTWRNWEVYGRFVPVGATFGENCYGGLNAPYKNFDLWAFNMTRKLSREERVDTLARSWFVEVEQEDAWGRTTAVKNTPDRIAANADRGVEFVRDHPSWFVRSRIKKAADLVVPLSFFLKHIGLGHYDEGPLGGLTVRRGLTLWAIASPLLLLAAGFTALLSGRLKDPSARLLFGAVILYFCSTTLIVSMSRFRVPFLPLLIVAAASYFTPRTEPSRSSRIGSRIGAAVAIFLLVFLWWVDWPEVRALFGFAWEDRA